MEGVEYIILLADAFLSLCVQCVCRGHDGRDGGGVEGEGGGAARL